MKKESTLVIFLFIFYEIIFFFYYILFNIFSEAFQGNEISASFVWSFFLLNFCLQNIKLICRFYIMTSKDCSILMDKECFFGKTLRININVLNILKFSCCYLMMLLLLLLMSLHTLLVFLTMFYKKGSCHQNILLDAG